MPGALQGLVLIVAPVGRDARLLQEVLAQAGVTGVVCSDAEAFRQRLEEGAEAAVLTQEAIPIIRDVLEPALAGQPAWSDLPLIVLVSPRSASAQHLRTDQLLAGNATVLERPLRVPTFLSVVRAASRARQRQYELRALVAELNELNATLEQRVRQRTRQVRDLAAALTLAEQRERRRLSELLHDHLQQLLFALKLKLQVLETADPAARADVAEQARQLADEAMRLTRTLSVELHPPVLDEDGLTVALEWVARQMEEQHALHVEVLADDACHVASRELLILLTRSVRELLFNVVKHAGTDRARVLIYEEDGALHIAVEDDGVGFDPADVEARAFQGTGLRALRERLHLLGGRLHTRTGEGAGVRTELEVPLHLLESRRLTER